MAYSEESDLFTLIKQLEFPTGYDFQGVIDSAAEEIDSKLGWVYKLPLRKTGTLDTSVTPESWKDLPTHQKLLLKQMNNKLAAGRLILQIAIPDEENGLHAYGLSLVREAKAELNVLANETVMLDATLASAQTEEATARMPGVHNEDDESMLAGFYNTTMRDEPWYSRPGHMG